MSQVENIKKPKWRKIVVAAMTVVVTLETCWIGISQVIAPNEIDPSEAQRFFLEFYYPEVLQDPAKTLNHLGTAQFRALKESTGMEKYISYYRRTSAIDRISLVRHNDEPHIEKRSGQEGEDCLRAGMCQHVASAYTVAALRLREPPDQLQCASSNGIGVPACRGRLTEGVRIEALQRPRRIGAVVHRHIRLLNPRVAPLHRLTAPAAPASIMANVRHRIC